jgi:hypothetical protein
MSDAEQLKYSKYITYRIPGSLKDLVSVRKNIEANLEHEVTKPNCS